MFWGFLAEMPFKQSKLVFLTCLYLLTWCLHRFAEPDSLYNSFTIALE